MEFLACFVRRYLSKVHSYLPVSSSRRHSPPSFHSQHASHSLSPRGFAKQASHLQQPYALFPCSSAAASAPYCRVGEVKPQCGWRQTAQSLFPTCCRSRTRSARCAIGPWQTCSKFGRCASPSLALSDFSSSFIPAAALLQPTARPTPGGGGFGRHNGPRCCAITEPLVLFTMPKEAASSTKQLFERGNSQISIPLLLDCQRQSLRLCFIDTDSQAAIRSALISF